MLRIVRQNRVFDWVTKAFGPDHANHVQQRSLRFLEEAIELYQAAGGNLDQAHKLLDFIFARPVGELSKEIGAVVLSLLSVAAAAGWDADEEEQREVDRVTSKDPEVFAERNRQKNEAGFDALAHSIPSYRGRINR